VEAAGRGDFLGARLRTELPDQPFRRGWMLVTRGDPAAMPAPEVRRGWSFGEPDLSVKMPEKYTSRRKDATSSRCFVVRSISPKTST